MDPDRQDASPSLTIIITEQSFPLNGALLYLACAIGIGHAELSKQYSCLVLLLTLRLALQPVSPNACGGLYWGESGEPRSARDCGTCSTTYYRLMR